MNNFDIFDEKKNFIKFCAEHNFVLKDRPTAAKDFMVITGKNGVGKSRLLQLIREYIVTIKNENYPYMIVRRLNYGEQDDEYDPDKTDHPLVTQNVLQSFNCNYQSWEKTIKILITPLKVCFKNLFGFIFGDLSDFEDFWKNLPNEIKAKEKSPFLENIEKFSKHLTHDKIEKEIIQCICRQIENYVSSDKQTSLIEVLLNFCKTKTKINFNSIKTFFTVIKDPISELLREKEGKEHEKILNDPKTELSQYLDYNSIEPFLNIFIEYFKQEKKNALMLIEHYEIYFKYYSTKSKSDTDITNPLKKYYEKIIYFEEFQKYFRRQMLKKICFGSLKQMLMLDMRYQFQLDEINEKIKEYEKYGLDFPYEIKKISKGFVDKSDVNERIIFTHIYEKKNVTFRDLSPGERLILHLILLIKDRENIKMENIDENIKQILLLDEPDSHCEANLVRIFIDIIDKELVNKMKIQVIMTTHNYLTICKIKEESLFVISKNGKELEIENDAGKCKSFDILAKNLIELFDITNQSVEVRASTYKGICEACKNGSLYGVLLENMFKSLTEKHKARLAKILLEIKDIDDDQINFEISYKNLSECNLNKLNKKEYNIIWPINQTNIAWDFMIYQNGTTKIVHFFQVTIDDSKTNETLKKHESYNIESNIEENMVDNIEFEYYYISPGIINKIKNSQNQKIDITLENGNGKKYLLNCLTFDYFIKKFLEIGLESTVSFFKFLKDYVDKIKCGCENTKCENNQCSCRKNALLCTDKCHKNSPPCNNL